MSRPARWIGIALLSLIGGALVLAILVAWLNVRGEAPVDATPPRAATAGQIERGAYLARAGNCLGCHTARGGTPYAGGRAVWQPRQLPARAR